MLQHQFPLAINDALSVGILAAEREMRWANGGDSQEQRQINQVTSCCTNRILREWNA